MNKSKFEEMDREVLEKLLKKKKEKYQEVEEEKHFVLSQSGRHIPGTLRREYKIELEQIKDRIDKIKEILAER